MPDHFSRLAIRLRELLPDNDAGAEVDRGAVLATLIREGLADLPMPAQGATRARWQALAAVAAHDLALAKLYEGHTDAIAICAEAGQAPPAGHESFGTWAAEMPGTRLVGRALGASTVRLDGFKPWCSGAASLDRGLLTFHDESGGGPWLASVSLRQADVSFDAGGWRAVGMAASNTVDVGFAGTLAERVGPEGFYLSRPGFWQGGAGIAACWHGAACALALQLRRATPADAAKGWHRQLALGRIDTILSANAALLREAADWIDVHPRADASACALKLRAATDAAAQEVLSQATRALGAGPLCRDAAFARRAADLPVFVRQSHGDRDLAALGARIAGQEDTLWSI